MIAKYQEHVVKYQNQDQTMDHQRALVELEREDLERLSSLLRGETEALETANLQLQQRIAELDKNGELREQTVKELRNENIYFNRERNQVMEEYQNFMIQFEKLEEESQKHKDYISLLCSNVTSLESSNVNLKNQNRSLSTQLLALQNSFEDLSLTKRLELESLEKDLESYKAKYHQCQLSLTRQT